MKTTLLLLLIGLSYFPFATKDSESAQKPLMDSDSIDIPMVYVEGGSFRMGCTAKYTPCRDAYGKVIGKPVHRVTVSSFYIGKYEVTFAQWRMVMGNNSYYSHFTDRNNYPLELSWEEVHRFIDTLNKKTGKNYRLPTEAEWEFAARGGNKSQGYKFAGSYDVNAVAWYQKNAYEEVQPVGKKAPNELGIHDMSGNLWEWCSDWERGYSVLPQKNPKGPKSKSGRYKVSRGGDINSDTDNVSVWVRGYKDIDPIFQFLFGDVGLRLVLEE